MEKFSQHKETHRVYLLKHRRQQQRFRYKILKVSYRNIDPILKQWMLLTQMFDSFPVFLVVDFCSRNQMRFLVQHIGDIKNPQDRAYLAIQALHPLRLEEVLGLQVADIDPDNMAIHICRAVTHPTRNQPEIKDTKTQSSTRTIGLSALAVPYLPQAKAGEFVFGGKAPLSYTQVRRMCDRIKRDIGFDENITPIRFRTTVLTDLYDQTKDIKLAQAAAEHTTSAMTLRYYVKGRETISKAAAVVDQAYSR